MRFLIKLSNFICVYKASAPISGYNANTIAVRSISAGTKLIAPFVISAIFTVSLASAREIGGSTWRATSAQGSTGKKTVIEVRTSPGVYLPGPTIKTEVTSAKAVTPRVTEFLQQTIEQTLLRNDPRLKVATTAADTSVVCTIIDLIVSPGVETRTRQEYQQTGTTTVTDPQTGVIRFEPTYSYVDVPYKALVLDGRMSLRCDVTHVATGILLFSDRFDALYSEARYIGGGGDQSVDDLNRIYLKLAESAAGLILAQLSPRAYSEIVTVPSGRLKEAGKLMESGLWTEALALLSSMPAFKNPKDDAYRLYCIGVSYEALGYKTLDPAEKKSKLHEALVNYQRAVELKPNEDMFWAPKYRAEAVLLQTSGLVAQVQLFEEAKKSGSRLAPAADPSSAASTGLFRQTTRGIQSGRLTIDNQTIVQWVKSGRSADYIAASIKHAPETRFDLSEVEVLKLRRAGVNKSVLKAMAKSQPGYYPGFGLTRAVIMAASMLWWLPWVFAR